MEHINTFPVRLSRKKITAKQIVMRAAAYVMLALLAVVLVFPYFLMISRGLMSTSRFSDSYMHVLPDKLVFKNYINAFGSGGYGMPLLNSIWVYVISAATIPFSSLVAAYAFVRLNWIGKKAVFVIMMALTMLPSVVTQVPLYVMYNSFNMLDTYLPILLPGIFFGGAINVFLARQFMISHPQEIYESATIDGAGPFRSFISITLPLCKTIFLYFAVSIFIAGWGDYYTPSVYLKNSEMSEITFAYALYRNLWSDENNLHPEYVFSACSIISLVPTVLYAVFQKYLVQGIATVGIKG